MSDSLQATIAANRFGLGASGADMPAAGDARQALMAQFARFQPSPPQLAAAPSRASVIAGIVEFRQAALAGRNLFDTPLANGRRRGGAADSSSEPAGMADASVLTESSMMAAGPAPQAAPDTDQAARRAYRQDLRQAYVTSVAARFDAALVSDTPFAERLVHFWSNHFAVSIDKAVTVGFAGLHEFEAIRPNIMGRFTQLLWAANTHPAMLLYLDQAQSIGPDSLLARRVGARRAANNRPIGLNENLAREILELHTLGVNGGYTQADVTEFARALTGITIPSLAPGPMQRLFAGDNSPPGTVSYVAVLHQPGARTLLGKRYPESDNDAQARGIIADLAVHPKTAAHLSFKLARHFTGDTPPQALVDRLTAAWMANGGNLLPWYRALIDSPEVWQAAPAKAKSPWEWMVSTGRALGWSTTPMPQRLVGLLNELGQPVWRPGSPAGYDDIDARWLAPDALLRRVEAADRLAALTSDSLDARALAERLFGPLLSDATRRAIAGAESNRQALALVLLSPEFMRR